MEFPVVDIEKLNKIRLEKLGIPTLDIHITYPETIDEDIENKINDFKWKSFLHKEYVKNSNLKFIDDMRTYLEENGFTNYEHFLYECSYRLSIKPLYKEAEYYKWDDSEAEHEGCVYVWDDKIVFFHNMDKYEQNIRIGTMHSGDYTDKNLGEKLYHKVYSTYKSKSLCDPYDPYDSDYLYEHDYVEYELNYRNYKKDLLKAIFYQEPSEDVKKLRLQVTEGNVSEPETPKYNGKINIAYYVYVLFCKTYNK